MFDVRMTSRSFSSTGVVGRPCLAQKLGRSDEDTPAAAERQDTSLLHRSIVENIRYGRPDATDETVIAAARQAHAHDFVVGLTDPDGRKGYDTLVGERGVKLSGGQRQRIAIARVLLKNASILVLDEATSALDSEGEAAIQENFQTLMEDKTVIVIAHRLSTLPRWTG
jgi:ATP-binding cassette subfamily B multidrug efflux pump